MSLDTILVELNHCKDRLEILQKNIHHHECIKSPILPYILDNQERYEQHYNRLLGNLRSKKAFNELHEYLTWYVEYLTPYITLEKK